jgi:nucleotide-binding universal stress UspA family protein
MALYSDLPIYQHGSELLSLAVDVQTQIARVYKRTLGEKIHQQCVDMLECMAMANALRGHDRADQIDKLLAHLRAATALLRVCHEKRQISPKLWARSIELLEAIGAQAGGWRKSALSSTAAPAA